MVDAIQLFVLATLVPFLAAKFTISEQNHLTYQLPGTSYPVHYSLRLQVPISFDFDNLYSGHVNISIKVPFPTNLIVLHSDSGNEIKSVDLKEGDSDITIAAVEHDYETQFLKVYTLHPLLPLENGTYQLLIDFSGRFERNAHQGFFMDSFLRGSERDGGRWESFYVATAFEPTSARSAFPCYDEPKYKATFDIEVICNREYCVYSNGDFMEEEDWGEGRKLMRFDRTPPMASYLVAILVSDHSEQIRNSDGVRIGILSRLDSRDSACLKFALDMTEKSLQALQDYTAQSYSFPKLYQVGIEDFGGGLENWGLILYDESFLFVDPKADILEKIDSAKLITHEVAQQFFGNLVGIIWWDHLWLKEGFATFMSNKLILQVLPVAGLVIQSQLDQATWAALDYDSSPLTHSMFYEVEHPHEIDALYYGSNYMIVYEKSSRVIRMMEQALGSDLFQKGVQNYITVNKFTSVYPSSLYQSLYEIMGTSSAIPQDTDCDVKQAFDSWVYQAGHPIVYVERIDDSGTYRFTQRPFKSCPCGHESRWWVPIFVRTFKVDEGINDTLAFWIPQSVGSVTVNIAAALLLVNAASYGFYRVDYCQQGWNEILPNWIRIDGSARAKLLDDAFSLQWDQEVYFEPLFLMLNKLQEDTDPLPWMAAMADHNLWRLVRLSLGKVEIEQKMKTVAKRFTSNMLSLFQNASSPVGVEARDRALEWACRLEMPSCQRSERSVNAYDVCSRLLSPQYVAGLRCDLRSFMKLIHTIDFKRCFTSRIVFQQFVNNVLQNFKCPAMLNLFVAVMNTGVPYMDELLKVLTTQTGYLELIVDGQHMEVFLRTAAYYIYDPDHLQLVLRFMERVEVITEEQRTMIQNLMAARMASVDGVLTSLKQYLDKSVTVEYEIDYE